MKPWIVAAARAIVGLTLLISGISKALAPAAFLAAIQAYPLSVHLPVVPLAALLPWAEGFLGFCLALGVLPRGASLLAGLLLVAYTAGLIQRAIVSPHDGNWLFEALDCGCGFGVVQVSVKLAENALLVGLCGLGLLSDDHRFVVVRLD